MDIVWQEWKIEWEVGIIFKMETSLVTTNLLQLDAYLGWLLCEMVRMFNM